MSVPSVGAYAVGEDKPILPVEVTLVPIYGITTVGAT